MERVPFATYFNMLTNLSLFLSLYLSIYLSLSLISLSLSLPTQFIVKYLSPHLPLPLSPQFYIARLLFLLYSFFRSHSRISRYLFVSSHFRLLEDNCIVLQCLGRALAFELAIGVNGRVWSNSANPLHTIIITNAILNVRWCYFIGLGGGLWGTCSVLFWICNFY